MPSIGSLNAILTLNSKRFERGMDRSRKQLRGFNKRVDRSSKLTRLFSGALTRAGTALAGLAGVAGIGRLFSSIEGFNQELRSSQAIMGELTQNQMRRMEQAAIQVARTTRTSTSEAARSFFFLASAGLDAEQSIRALPKVAKFAQAGMFDMATATDLATDAQSALGLKSQDAAENTRQLQRVMDVLVKSNTLANASVQQFSETITNKLGPRLRALNKDIEEGAAAMAAMADQGIKSRKAGERLNILFRDLAEAAATGKESMGEFAQVVFDSEGNMRNIADIVEGFEKRLNGLSNEARAAALSQTGLSKRARDALVNILGTSEAIRGYERELRNAGGTTQEVADKQLTPFAKGWAQLSAAVVQVGQSMDGLIDNVGRLMGFIGRNLKTIVQMTASFAAFVGTGPAIIGTITAIFTAIRKLSAGITLIQLLIAGPRGIMNLMLGLAGATAVWFGLEAAIGDTGDAMAQASDSTKKLKKDVDEAVDGATDFKSNVDDAKDSVDKLSKSIEQSPLERFAARLREQTRKPLEELRLQLFRITVALQEGAIGMDTFMRAGKQAFRKFNDATQDQRPRRFDAMRRGERETVNRILRFQTQSRSMNVEKANLQESKQQTKELRGIRRNTADNGGGGGQDVVVNF